MPQKCPKSLWWWVGGVWVVGKPNLVKDFCPRLPLDLCFDFDFGLGQAFQQGGRKGKGEEWWFYGYPQEGLRVASQKPASVYANKPPLTHINPLLDNINRKSAFCASAQITHYGWSE